MSASLAFGSTTSSSSSTSSWTVKWVCLSFLPSLPLLSWGRSSRCKNQQSSFESLELAVSEKINPDRNRLPLMSVAWVWINVLSPPNYWTEWDSATLMLCWENSMSVAATIGVSIFVFAPTASPNCFKSRYWTKGDFCWLIIAGNFCVQFLFWRRKKNLRRILHQLYSSRLEYLVSSHNLSKHWFSDDNSIIRG